MTNFTDLYRSMKFLHWITPSPSLLFLTILYPQGSVLGPQWFTVYTSPVRDIILKYNLNYHVYADDTQLYITFKSSQEPADSCITTLDKCIQEIRSWMRQNFLKLNDEKTVSSIWITSAIIKSLSSIYYNW